MLTTVKQMFVSHFFNCILKERIYIVPTVLAVFADLGAIESVEVVSAIHAIGTRMHRCKEHVFDVAFFLRRELLDLQIRHLGGR